MNRLEAFLERLAQNAPDWMHKKAGWAQSGPLFTHQPAQPQVKLQAQFDVPGVYSVQFGIQETNGIPYQVLGEIFFIVNGNPIRRVVSPMNGMSITGFADTIWANLYDDSIDDGTPSAQYTGIINTTPGARPAQSQPPTLRVWGQAQTILAGASTEVEIPRSSGVISFRLSVFNPSGDAPALVIFTDDNSTVYGQELVAAGQNSFIPVPSGTTAVVITNTDGANPILVSGQWGIDG